MIIFYQDRLGTTLGKALKKEWRFLRALDASAASSSRSSGAAAGPATGGDSGYDVIVGSDLAYHRDTGPSLLYTIKALSSPATVTLIALPHRSTQNAAEQIAAMAQASGEKTHLLCHLILLNDHFTKTGSGQTSTGKALKKKSECVSFLQGCNPGLYMRSGGSLC